MSDTPPPAAPEPTPAPAPTPPVVNSPDAALAADIEKNKVLALLSYLGILWLVPLLAAKDSPYAKFHCNQGIVLSIAFFAAYFVVGIIGVIPWVNCILCVLFPAVALGHVTFVIMGIINALNGKMKPLPLFPVVTWVK